MKTRIVWSKPTGSGRRTGWARTVRDLDRSRVGAKALVGEYLQDEVETELEVGTLVLQVKPIGSVKNGFDGAALYRVSEQGRLEPCPCSADGLYWDWRKQWLSIADAVAEELNVAAEAAETQGDALVALTDALIESLNNQNDRLVAGELGIPESALNAFCLANGALSTLTPEDRALVLAKLAEVEN
jgi:hypothetical protein